MGAVCSERGWGELRPTSKAVECNVGHSVLEDFDAFMMRRAYCGLLMLTIGSELW